MIFADEMTSCEGDREVGLQRRSRARQWTKVLARVSGIKYRMRRRTKLRQGRLPLRHRSCNETQRCFAA